MKQKVVVLLTTKIINFLNNCAFFSKTLEYGEEIDEDGLEEVDDDGILEVDIIDDSIV